MYKQFDKATLEREYSPSSCVDDINVFIQQYIDLSESATSQAIAERSALLDLQYGSHADESIDLYLPIKKSDVLPIRNTKKLQVYIHGGYWQQLTKIESSFAARNFQQQGCHFAVINYSLAPNATLTQIVEQNRKAIAWLAHFAEKLGFDASEIYLSGSSAGGHLALMMLQTDWQSYIDDSALTDTKPFIKGVCAVSGIYDIEPITQTSVNDALQLTAEEVQVNSPIRHNTINKCPVIIAYGDNETSEFKRQSMAMKTHLEDAGFSVPFKEIAHRNHFDVIIDLSDSESWLSQQVFKQMKL
ncbi:MAG: alpha/beta hydrolase [Shewanella sp.]|nr:alpha/beta hydrolase [Shewanella sp.]